ncbi:MAG: hypothetical protein JRJ79_18335 [Deltaproteobacteria bacterium]|nr:hypothetical protein [Deltaproteobacteria bacterium]
MGFSEQVFINFGIVAIDNALKDADIEWKQIQAIMAGIFVWGGNAGHLSGQYHESVFGETGVPVINVWNACATGTAALQMAYNTWHLAPMYRPKAFLPPKQTMLFRIGTSSDGKWSACLTLFSGRWNAEKEWLNMALPKRIWHW